MNKFEEAAEANRKSHVLREVWFFLNHTKKWWLLPIIIILVGFGALVVLSGTGAAPFIYSLF